MGAGLLLGKMIRTHELSVREAIDASLDVIEKKDGDINAFITVCDKEALYLRADEVQKRIDAGELDESPLAGVPIAVKDNICTKGIRTTCGSKMLESFIPPYSSTAVDNLEKAGAIVIGKTNLDEFGMGSTTETSFYGVTKNPHDLTCVAGGSSGGSAAAVAAGMVPIALGSDTGGSIRLPAAYCGVTGLKPTYGTVSRYGLTAYGSSLEQIGPIATDPLDCAALLSVITGVDPHDSTSVIHEDPISIDRISTTVEGIKVGVPRRLLESTDISDEIVSGINSVADELKDMGATIVDVDIDLSEYVVPAYYIIACAEASSNLARFDGVKYGYRASKYATLKEMYERTHETGFGEEVKKRIELGNYVLSQGFYDDYYIKACRIRRLIKEAFDTALKGVHVILMPVTKEMAPRIGEYEKDPIRMYQDDLFTVAANLTGYPAMSFPFRTTSMPVGVGLIAGAFQESRMISVASQYASVGTQ